MQCDLDWTKALSVVLAVCVAACGGGVDGPASIPAPVPTPTPAPPPDVSVKFLEAPATSQEFAAFTSGDSLRIRYDAQTHMYEVMAPGNGWESLYADPSFGADTYHMPGPMEDLGRVYARTRFDHPDSLLRYHYSSLASWSRGYPDETDWQEGFIAFGLATPPGGVPVTGSAEYRGVLEGSASVPVVAGNGFGGWDRAPVGGTVLLQFDFGKGSLAGEIRPREACDCAPIDPVALPTLRFVDTVFAVGSRNYSGRFATDVVGPNAFSGIFTGPRAEESIGKWAFPFLFKGVPQAAEGAWVAKRGD